MKNFLILASLLISGSSFADVGNPTKVSCEGQDSSFIVYTTAVGQLIGVYTKGEESRVLKCEAAEEKEHHIDESYSRYSCYEGVSIDAGLSADVYVFGFLGTTFVKINELAGLGTLSVQVDHLPCN